MNFVFLSPNAKAARAGLQKIRGGISLILTGAAVLAALAPAAPAAAKKNGAELFLRSALAIDVAAETVTLPLFRGRTPSGDNAWYIVTESSNKDDAERRGVNPAPKLANAIGTAAVQKVRMVGGRVEFAGTVDFSPTRVVVPSSPNGFPPDQFAPGAVGDANYSPLITTGNGIVLNASQVANSTGTHDSVVGINYAARRVTLRMLRGFYDGKPIIYLRMDASIPLLAAIEASTFAPNLNAAPGIASDDKHTSAREAIIPIVNGPRGINNPERQGLESALLGEGDPLNIIQEEPGDNEYSPVWDVHPAVWTDAAIAAGLRRQLQSAQEVRREFSRGNIISADFSTGPPNKSLKGLRAGGFISNCPVVAQLED